VGRLQSARCPVRWRTSCRGSAGVSATADRTNRPNRSVRYNSSPAGRAPGRNLGPVAQRVGSLKDVVEGRHRVVAPAATAMAEPPAPPAWAGPAPTVTPAPPAPVAEVAALEPAASDGARARTGVVQVRVPRAVGRERVVAVVGAVVEERAVLADVREGPHAQP